MTDMLPPPAASTPTPSRTTTLIVWVVCGFIMLLTAMAAGGYVLRQELRALASARPEAPPEVTQALADLNDKLERQRRDDAAQLASLQKELAALKEQQAATTMPDMQASIAPLQEKLDAIASQLAQPPVPPAPPAPVMVEEATPATVETPPVAEPIATAPTPLQALASAVKRGEPYADELEALAPQLGDHLAQPLAVLKAHAATGVPSARQLRARQLEETPAAPLPGWAESLNTRLPSLVRIKPSAPALTHEQETALLAAQGAREDVLDALAILQAESR